MSLERLVIFDTTLRDGEQCPGASLNRKEKLEIARKLAALKVDVIEAGFPVASPGDFDSVKEIAREIRGSSIAGLARALEKDIESRSPRPRKSRITAYPHISFDIKNTPRTQTSEKQI